MSSFNPKDILSKIRKNEYIPSNLEKHLEKSSSSNNNSSGQIVPQSFTYDQQPPSDQEYIGNLLNNIQKLESKVNSLELELADSKNTINILKMEKNSLENQVNHINTSNFLYK